MTDEIETKPAERLTPKEYAKQQRRKAYELAKERRKSDPRHAAMKEKLKQQRREAYQKAKARKKILKAERKGAAAERTAKEKTAKQQALMATLVPASKLQPVKKPRRGDEQ